LNPSAALSGFSSVANAVLVAHGFPPLSYRSIDEQAYKGALILVYAQGRWSTSKSCSSASWRTRR
jgi:hypothetical protein